VSIIFPRKRVSNMFVGRDCSERVTYRRRSDLAILVPHCSLIGGIGIYGVMSYFVSQRTREFGMRIALGADLAQILRLVIAHGLKLTLSGVLIGVVGGLALTRFLRSLLFSISAADPLTFASVAFLLTLVAMVAAMSPHAAPPRSIP
jgi:putative ABC transport system permease protein